MQSKIPIPTDNIYKFYALFGLLIIVSSILAVSYISTNTNNEIHSLVNEYYFLEAKDETDKTALEELIEKRLDVAVKNKKLYLHALGVFIAIGVLLSFHGFKQWHTQYQPKLDRMLDLQIEQLEITNRHAKNDTSK